jgi:hypothetical protein
MGCVEGDREMKRRRKRREKLKKIRKIYAATSSAGEKADLLAKARKISPLFSFDE